MRIVIPLFLSLLLANACVKKKFEAIKTPSVIMLNPLNQAGGEVTPDYMGKEKKRWANYFNRTDTVKVDGILRVTYKEKDHFYYQIHCPSKNKKCETDKLYLPTRFAHDDRAGSNPFSSKINKAKTEEVITQYLLREKDRAEGVRNFQRWVAAWLQGSTNIPEVPSQFDGYLLKHQLEKYNTEAGWPRTAEAQLFVYASDLAPKNEGEVKKKSRSISFVDASEEQKAVLKQVAGALKDNYKQNKKAYLARFPYSARALTKEFAQLADDIYYRGAVLAKAIKGATVLMVHEGNKSFKIANVAKDANLNQMLAEFRSKHPQVIAAPPLSEATADANTSSAPEPEKDTLKIGAKLGERLFIKTSSADVAIASIDGIKSKLGLAFHINAGKDDAMKIYPLTKPKYFKLFTTKDVKKLKKKLKYADDDSFQHFMLKRVIKHGKVEFDDEKRTFNYELTLGKKHFWKFLKAVKTLNVIDTNEHDYHGSVGAGDEYGEHTWYQKKKGNYAAFGIRSVIEMCGCGGCDTSKGNQICFDTDSDLNVQISPLVMRALLTEKQPTISQSDIKFSFNNGQQQKNEDEYSEIPNCSTLLNGYSDEEN